MTARVSWQQLAACRTYSCDESGSFMPWSRLHTNVVGHVGVKDAWSPREDG
jgi:hypothetical protein